MKRSFCDWSYCVAPIFFPVLFIFGKNLYIWVVYNIKCLWVDATIVVVCIFIIMCYIRSIILQKDYHISLKILSQELEKENKDFFSETITLSYGDVMS